MSNKAVMRFLAVFFAGITVLLGVVIYFALSGGDEVLPPGAPLRTAVWLADSERPADQRRDVIILIEEVAGETPGALLLPARLDGVALLPERRRGEQAAAALAEILGRRVHHYLVLSRPALERLLTITGGVSTAAGALAPGAALDYLFDAPTVDERLQRAPEVLWGMADRVFAGQVDAGVGDLMALASALETDLRTSALQDMLLRWGAARPVARPAPGGPSGDGWQLDRAALDRLLRPDPTPSPSAR